MSPNFQRPPLPIATAIATNCRLVELLIALGIRYPNTSNKVHEALSRKGVLNHHSSPLRFSFVNLQIFKPIWGFAYPDQWRFPTALVKRTSASNPNEFKDVVIDNLNRWVGEIENTYRALDDEELDLVERLVLLKATRHYTQNVLFHLAAHYQTHLVATLGKFNEKSKVAEVEREISKIRNRYAVLNSAKTEQLLATISRSQKEVETLRQGALYIRKRAELFKTERKEYPLMLNFIE